MADHPDARAIQAMYQAYNERSLTGWLAAFHPEAVWTNIPTGERFVGHEGQRTNYAAWDTPFPSGQCVDLHVGGGNGVYVGEFIGAGTNTGPLPGPDGTQLPPTNRQSEIAFCDVHEVSEGLIVNTRRYWDQDAVIRQLGL